MEFQSQQDCVTEIKDLQIIMIETLCTKCWHIMLKL